MVVVRMAYWVAITVSDWVDARDKRRRIQRSLNDGLTLKQILDLKKEGEAVMRRSNAPTVVIPPPSERKERGGGSSRY